MVRSAASKVAWVGRTASMVFGLALVLALVFGVASMALGANGQSFLLGKWNAATALTKLTGNVNGSAMQVVNPNAGTNDTALSLSVQAGEAPMRVNSNARVANLNAASAGRADSAGHADTATNAQNANTLDNKDSTAFLGKTEKAADADMLGGQAPSTYQKRVSGECPAGQSIRSVGADGTTIACEPDDDAAASARVWGGGAPYFVQNSGFASVTRTGVGQYCLEPQSGVDVRNSAVVVSIDWTGTNPQEGAAEAMYVGFCGTDGIRIVTERLSVSDGVLNSNENDYVSFHVIVA